MTGTDPLKKAIVPEKLYQRTHFEHPALTRVDNLNAQQPQKLVTKEKVEALALAAGLDKVLRWKPAKVSPKLTTSLSRLIGPPSRGDNTLFCSFFLTVSFPARKPFWLGPANCSQLGSLCYRRSHHPAARRRSGR